MRRRHREKHQQCHQAADDPPRVARRHAELSQVHTVLDGRHTAKFSDGEQTRRVRRPVAITRIDRREPDSFARALHVGCDRGPPSDENWAAGEQCVTYDVETWVRLPEARPTISSRSPSSAPPRAGTPPTTRSRQIAARTPERAKGTGRLFTDRVARSESHRAHPGCVAPAGRGRPSSQRWLRRRAARCPAAGRARSRPGRRSPHLCR